MDYSKIALERSLYSNVCIIGKRRSGKTTTLFKIVKELEKLGKPLAILDSATAHGEISLINKLKRDGKYRDLYLSPEEGEIKSPNEIISIIERNLFDEVTNWFPQLSGKIKKGKTLLFDLSYYVEKSHEVSHPSSSIEREKYRALVNQILLKLLYHARETSLSRIWIITDEIEFSTPSREILSHFNNYRLISAVHNIYYLSTSTSLFKCFINLNSNSILYF